MKKPTFKIFLYLLPISFLFSSISVSAQHEYFGLTPPGNTPEVFAPDFISTEAFEFCGMFTPDGKEYFFTRRNSYEGSENRIYQTKFKRGEWIRPQLASFSKDVFEFEPQIDPNGNKIYFYSERSGNRDDRFDGDLWISYKTTSGWSDPDHFKSIVNKKWCMSVSPALDGTLYFSSFFVSNRGVFNSEKDDGYSTVTYLPESINSRYFAHPYIAPDESYMLMDARVGGMGKSAIFISFNKDGKWSEPVMLGPEINATQTEFGASVSPDGKYLFFHRRVEGNGDIYWVSSEFMNELR
ncbi:MAG: hypothetical protein CL663_07090 [Bacteroidetes bacterium]|nr:hypothetical protein [Bacteroidota bacterium]|tara:strand:+ start:22 stop:909 length:888 start_codon:yes stop_codon:yes gene_type:complete